MIFLAVLATLSANQIVAPADGTELHYRGHFVAEKGDIAASEKQFELVAVVAREDETRTSILWTTEERGRGGWPWLDRFGRWELNDRLRPVAGLGPTLCYERPDGFSIVPLQPPFLTGSEPLADGVAWFEGPLEYRVMDSEQVGKVECWRIEARSAIGRKRTVWVDKASPVVLALTETVFVGQGEQHELRWELVQREVAEAARSAATKSAFQELLRLKDQLGIEPRSRDTRWTPERLGLLRTGLPRVVGQATGTPLAKVVRSAEQDAKNQQERAGALGALQGKLLGSAAPRPPLETLTGEKFAWSELAGKVTILHFWEYRDAPLEEPYGQVAYLDFLARRWAMGDVRVYGVISDERVTQPDTKKAGIQSAKRLQAFMNLSYPLLVDATGGSKEFGDPRAAGAKLPLFVVVDRQGKIIHHHAGHYEVNRDRGLEELENTVRKTLEANN